MSPPIIQINGMVCAICDAKNGVMRWTDTHGIAACIQCGAPYQILFYDGEGRDRVRIDHDPELLILPAWRELAVRYVVQCARKRTAGSGRGDRMTTAELAAHHHQLSALLVQTAHCDHFADGRSPLPGCAWCDLWDRLDATENAMALADGHEMPNKRGKS